MTDSPTHTWSSPEYVATWIDQDSQANLLRMPRQLSAALVADAGTEVQRVIDLGSGTGVYLRVLLAAFPDAQAVWVDGSEPMQERAREELADLGDQVTYVLGDASRPSELDLGEADVVTTSRMVHHFGPDTIRALYATVRGLLRPGGYFFNLDHFGSPEGWEDRYRRIRGRFIGRPESEKRSHPHDHAFSRLDQHLRWIEEAGFAEPDVPWKTFFTALIAAPSG